MKAKHASSLSPKVTSMKHPKLDWLITCTEDDINSSPRKHTNVFMYCMDVCVFYTVKLSPQPHVPVIFGL